MMLLAASHLVNPINTSHGASRIKNVIARIHTREQPFELDGSLGQPTAKVSLTEIGPW